MGYVKTYRNSKNLFDKSTADIYNNSRVDTTNDVWMIYGGEGKTVRIPINPLTTYSLSIDSDITTTVFRILVISTDDVPTVQAPEVYGRTLTISSETNSATFTTLTSSKYIIFQVHDQVFTDAINSLMIVQGNIPYKYEAYNVTAWYDFCELKTATGWTPGTPVKAPF